MRSITNRIRTGFLNYLSPTNQVTYGRANVTVINHFKAHIENHRGLITYNTKQLVVKVEDGFIEIKGASFVLTMLLKEEVFLEGTIDQINFISEI